MSMFFNFSNEKSLGLSILSLLLVINFTGLVSEISSYPSNEYTTEYFLLVFSNK